MRNLDDAWVTLADGHRFTLLHWIAGRHVERAARPVHFERVGRTLARLHAHVATWQPPAGFARPRWDADGIFGEEEFVAPGGVGPWNRVPKKHLAIFRRAERWARAAHDGLGPLTLIHADLHLGNVVFAAGVAHPIDFDDCGFGHLAHDFSVALTQVRRRADYEAFRAALLRGYAEVRPVPERHVVHLDPVIAGRVLGLALWVIAMSDHVPAHRERLPLYLARYHDTLAWLLTESRVR